MEDFRKINGTLRQELGQKKWERLKVEEKMEKERGMGDYREGWRKIGKLR